MGGYILGLNLTQNTMGSSFSPLVRRPRAGNKPGPNRPFLNQLFFDVLNFLKMFEIELLTDGQRRLLNNVCDQATNTGWVTPFSQSKIMSLYRATSTEADREA